MSTCKFCNATDLTWQKVHTKYGTRNRLFSGGTPHVCLAQPSFPKTIKHGNRNYRWHGGATGDVERCC